MRPRSRWARSWPWSSTAASTSCGAVSAAGSAARRARARTSTTTSPRVTWSATSSCAAGHGWAFDGRGHTYKRNEFGRVDPKGTVRALHAPRAAPTASTSNATAFTNVDRSWPTVYPPDRHLLRDLRLSFEHGGDAAIARAGPGCRWCPSCAQPTVRCGRARWRRSSTSSAAASRRRPRIPAGSRPPTSRCTSCAPRRGGSVEARARVVHAGRTTVVIEVELYDDEGAELGIATDELRRAPAPRRQPRHQHRARPSGPSTMALAELASARTAARRARRARDRRRARRARSAGRRLEPQLVRRDAGRRGRDRSSTPRPKRSRSAATGDALVVTDIQLTYLALARVGPLRTRVDVLGVGARHGHRPSRARRHRSRVTRHDRRPRRRDVVAPRQPVTDPGPADTDRDYSGPETGREVSRYVRVELHEVESRRT